MVESRRGRPRDPKVRAAILSAAYALLQQGGLGAVTMEGVAEQAGVGKPTVYRWWPNSRAVAMAALMEHAGASGALSRSKSPIAALRRQLRALAEIFATPLGRSVGLMLASSDSQTELSKSFRNHFLFARREEGRVLLERAIDAGEVWRGIDVDAALDLLYGAIFYRLIATIPGSFDASYTDRMLSLLLAGISAE